MSDRYIGKFCSLGFLLPILKRVSDNTYWCYDCNWKNLIGPFENYSDAFSIWMKSISEYNDEEENMRWRKDKPIKEMDNVLICDKTKKIWFGSFKFSAGINDIRFLSSELAVTFFLSEIVAWTKVNKPVFKKG